MKNFILDDLFVESYLANGLNMQKTARALGINRNKAQGLMNKAYVKVKIDEGIRRRTAMAGVKADHVLAEVSHLAYANMGDFHKIDEQGHPYLDMRDITRDQWAAVAEVQTIVDAEGVTRTRLKLHDKPRALELLGRHLKLFTDKLEIDGLDRLADELKAARERAMNR